MLPIPPIKGTRKLLRHEDDLPDRHLFSPRRWCVANVEDLDPTAVAWHLPGRQNDQPPPHCYTSFGDTNMLVLISKCKTLKQDLVILCEVGATTPPKKNASSFHPCIIYMIVSTSLKTNSHDTRKNNLVSKQPTGMIRKKKKKKTSTRKKINATSRTPLSHFFTSSIPCSKGPTKTQWPLWCSMGRWLYICRTSMD